MFPSFSESFDYPNALSTDNPPMPSPLPPPSPNNSHPDNSSIPSPINPTQLPVPNHQLRRSTRNTKIPTHLNDFICNHVYLTNVSDTCFSQPAQPSTFSFGALSLQNQHLLGSISTIVEPTSFEQACLDPN